MVTTNVTVGVVKTVNNSVNEAENTAEINGETFRFIKHPENNNPANANIFETYDYGLDFNRGGKEVWKVFQWTGGDLNNDDNFIVHDYLRIQPIP